MQFFLAVKTYTVNALKYWTTESRYIKATLDYQKIEIFINQNTFIIAMRL